MLYSASAYSVINISRSKQKNVWWHSWRDIYYIISSICFVSCFGPPFTGGVKIWWGDACSNRVCIHIFFNHETLPTRLYFVFFKISATFAFQVKCIAIIKRLSASSEMHSIWYQKQTRCPLGNTKSYTLQRACFSASSKLGAAWGQCKTYSDHFNWQSVTAGLWWPWLPLGKQAMKQCTM